MQEYYHIIQRETRYIFINFAVIRHKFNRNLIDGDHFSFEFIDQIALCELLLLHLLVGLG